MKPTMAPREGDPRQAQVREGRTVDAQAPPLQSSEAKGRGSRLHTVHRGTRRRKGAYVCNLRRFYAGLGMSLVTVFGLAVGCASSPAPHVVPRLQDYRVSCGCTCSDGGGATGVGSGASRSDAVEAAYGSCRDDGCAPRSVKSYDSCFDL